MSATKSGEFKRLTIRGYKKFKDLKGGAKEGKDIKKGFKVMFNPEKYTRKLEFKTGLKGSMHKKWILPRQLKHNEFSLEFTIDGTNTIGVIPFQKKETKEYSKHDPVTRKVIEFEETVFQEWKKQKIPKYLIIEWGQERRFCIIKSSSIDYTLFKPDGTPLRAVIKADFIESSFERLEQTENNAGDGPKTKKQLTVDGENLPSMTYAIFGSTHMMVAIAVFNQLDTLRSLPPGRNLNIPLL